MDAKIFHQALQCLQYLHLEAQKISTMYTEVKIAFCEFLRERAMKAINCKKKKMKLSTKEQQESSENAKICYICKENILRKYLKDQKYCKVRDHCNYTGEYSFIFIIIQL